MGRGKVGKIRASIQQEPSVIRAPTANLLDCSCSSSPREEYSLVRPPASLFSKIYLPKQTMLMAAIFPIAKIPYHWEEFFTNKYTMPLIFKFFVILLVSSTSAAVASTAVWWPRQFKNKMEIDTKSSRMGILFCIFGAQVGQSTCESIAQSWGRRLLTFMALAVTVIWEQLTRSWRQKETFLLGCFLCGTAIPTYLCISKSILFELFTGPLLNFVFFIYTIITLVGIKISRPTPKVASRYLLVLLLTVPSTYLTNASSYENIY